MISKAYGSRLCKCGKWAAMAVAIVLTLLAAVAVPAPLSAGLPPEMAERVQGLIDKVGEQGTVRVIVGLNAAFVPEGELPGPQAAQVQRQGIGAAQDAFLRRMAGKELDLIARFRYIPYVAVEVDAAALAALAALPGVTSVVEDVPVPPVLASATAVIGAPTAWAQGYTGQGWTVAVLDTGVDKTHSYFSAGGDKVVSEACYSTNSGLSTTLCPGGVEASTAVGSGVNCPPGVYGCNHGTHVAGIAAGDDGTGPNYGVGRGADLIAIQVFSRFTTYCVLAGLPSPCALSYSTDQIRGLERVYALRSTYDIAAVNLSLGGGEYAAPCDGDDPAFKAAVDNLRSVRIATVIASGNLGYRDAISRPACISTAISVGATEDDDDVASFANVASFLDLLAPGADITSSVPGGGTATWDGTSMAAPMVTGAWAVIRQAMPTAGVADVLSLVRDNGVSVDDNRSGGVVDDMRRINLGGVFATQTTIDKSVVPSTGVAYHGTVTYTLVLENAGTTDDPAVLLTDTLPAEVDFGAWIEQPDGTTVSGDEITWTGAVAAGEAITFSFAAVHVGGYGETVTNTAEFSATSRAGTDDATFTVVANQAPIADAGSDRTVRIDSVVTLDGSGSSDPEGHTPLAFGWTQTGGMPVTLSSSALSAPTFTAPSSAGLLTFTLAVTDSLGLASLAPDEVVISVAEQITSYLYLPFILGEPGGAVELSGQAPVVAPGVGATGLEVDLVHDRRSPWR